MSEGIERGNELCAVRANGIRDAEGVPLASISARWQRPKTDNRKLLPAFLLCASNEFLKFFRGDCWLFGVGATDHRRIPF